MKTSQPLKIGFVLDDSLDKPDGVQQYVLALGAWLSGQGHDVHYLTSTTKRQDVPNIHSLGKNMAVRFNANRMSMPLPANKAGITAFLAHQQFDVLHVQLPHSPWLAARVVEAADKSTAIVGTFHIVPNGWVVRAASRALATWTRPSLKRFDRLVSVSTAAQSFAKRTFHLNSTVLPNVVDYDRFAHAEPFEKYTDERVNVVFLGRLVPRKGCMTLLQALDILAKRRRGDVPALRVLIGGRGPLEAKLKAYVTEHQLESLVEFTGFIAEEDKPRYLQSADIAVFPSTGGESFGIVLIEAMAAGSMVLGGDNVGYRSVIGVRPELLFQPRKPIVLADKLAHYLADTAAREEAAAWGREYVRQYDIDVVGQQIEQIYSEALLERRNVR
jgi:phosphatidylinositol alpha-mannosyltransferase